MDYSSASGSSAALAATGLGLFGGAMGQLWLLAIVVLILGGVVLMIKANFRRDKTPDDI